MIDLNPLIETDQNLLTMIELSRSVKIDQNPLITIDQGHLIKIDQLKNNSIIGQEIITEIEITMLPEEIINKEEISTKIITEIEIKDLTLIKTINSIKTTEIKENTIKEKTSH